MVQQMVAHDISDLSNALTVLRNDELGVVTINRINGSGQETVSIPFAQLKMVRSAIDQVHGNLVATGKLKNGNSHGH